MPAPTPHPVPARPAESRPAWSPLAALLAPAAPCDCQLLAITLAAELEARTPATKRIAER